MENPEKDFVKYASSHNNEVGGDSMARVNSISIYHPENAWRNNRGEEVKEESEESEEETEEEEEDDPKYFDTFPTIKELGYHE
nr:hypothetical protein [Tanacetum cinerariifolium]